MDQVIWVEILSRRRDVAARLRFSGPEIRIGRAYDNDVVLDDPFVAASHVRVSRSANGELVAEDTGSANGMFLDRDKRRQDRIVVDGEHPIRIGRTLLRIREGSHTVPAERVGRLAPRMLPVAVVAGLALAVLGIEVLSDWLAETGEPKLSNYLARLLMVAGVIVAWVGGWALTSRLLSGQAHVERNLLIALTGVLVYSLYNEFAQFSAFALGWSAVSDYGYIAMWCILGTAFFLHWREASPSRLKLKGALVVGLFAVALAFQALKQYELPADFGRQTTMRRLLPPSLRLVPARDQGSFFDEVERLKAKLDRDRAE
jgi:pSer/pThr/pTyr-binding forkhead associated (FHA) protein